MHKYLCALGTQVKTIASELALTFKSEDKKSTRCDSEDDHRLDAFR